MTRKEALAALIANVEAGETPVTWRAFDGDERTLMFIHNAFHGSLDAAKALHEAVLPGWAWSIDRMGQAMVWYPWVEGDSITHEAKATDPARAWLLAILRALHAKEADQ